jgi:hypothetical protein
VLVDIDNGNVEPGALSQELHIASDEFTAQPNGEDRLRSCNLYDKMRQIEAVGDIRRRAASLAGAGRKGKGSEDRFERAMHGFVTKNEAVAERLVGQHALPTEQKLACEIPANPA